MHRNRKRMREGNKKGDNDIQHIINFPASNFCLCRSNSCLPVNVTFKMASRDVLPMCVCVCVCVCVFVCVCVYMFMFVSLSLL